jgi:hypothetical protein
LVPTGSTARRRSAGGTLSEANKAGKPQRVVNATGRSRPSKNRKFSYNPRFLLRQAARTLPSTCSLFFALFFRWHALACGVQGDRSACATSPPDCLDRSEAKNNLRVHEFQASTGARAILREINGIFLKLAARQMTGAGLCRLFPLLSSREGMLAAARDPFSTGQPHATFVRHMYGIGDGRSNRLSRRLCSLTNGDCHE